MSPAVAGREEPLPLPFPSLPEAEAEEMRAT